MLPLTMQKISPAILLGVAGLIASTAAFAGMALQTGSTIQASTAAQAGPSLSLDDCTEVEAGDLLQLEIRISGVQNLLAWEVFFAFDRDLVEVMDRDVRDFLSQGPNSNVFDFSDPVPNSTGIYRLAAADVALGATAESGAGVLATLTLRARADGVSPAVIFRDDVDGDGETDLGPKLTATGGGGIGDTNGDDIFDGSIQSGQIAIGESCLPSPPTPDPEDIIAAVPSPSASPGPAATGTAQPTGDSTGETPTATPNTTPGDSDTGSPQTSTATPPGPGDGTENDPDSSSVSTTWIIGIIGAALALGLVVSYIVVRTTRKRV